MFLVFRTYELKKYGQNQSTFRKKIWFSILSLNSVQNHITEITMTAGNIAKYPPSRLVYWNPWGLHSVKILLGNIHLRYNKYIIFIQVMEAIDILIRNSAYKDAVCLARMRLSPTDPKLREIYTRWAGILAKDSNLEVAAKW